MFFFHRCWNTKSVKITVSWLSHITNWKMNSLNFSSPELKPKLKSSLCVEELSQINETQQTSSSSDNLWVFAKICRYVCFFFALDRPQQFFIPRRRVMKKLLPWQIQCLTICYNLIKIFKLPNSTVLQAKIPVKSDSCWKCSKASE